MESISIPVGAPKSEKYEVLLPQIFALIEGERDLIANLANISAALKQGMGFFWVGFYLVRRSLLDPKDTHGELVLGPFQGPVACTRIGYGRGVCGGAWAGEKTLVVPDVAKFPGHIACHSDTRSEITIPFYLQPQLKGKGRDVMGVLDVDSERAAAFDTVDETYLKRILDQLY